MPGGSWHEKAHDALTIVLTPAAILNVVGRLKEWGVDVVEFVVEKLDDNGSAKEIHHVITVPAGRAWYLGSGTTASRYCTYKPF